MRLDAAERPSRSVEGLRHVTGTSAAGGQKWAADVATVVDPRIAIAISEIQDQFGITVEVKPKTLLKFGRSQQVSSTTRTTIMELPAGTLNETYVDDNLITTISSSSTADTQEIEVEGHTIDEDGNFTFVVQQVTLNGQNQVSLATPLARVSRAFNNNNVDLAGDVYVYEDDTTSAGVPDTDSLVHLLIRGSENRNQSFKASTTISNVDFYIVTQFAVSLEAKQASFVDGELEVRLKGGVFRERLNLAASSSGGIAQVDLNPALIIPNNSDVRIRGLADSNGRTVSGYINGYLAINQNVI